MEDWFDEVVLELNQTLGRFSGQYINRISQLIDDGKFDEAQKEYQNLVNMSNLVKKLS